MPVKDVARGADELVRAEPETSVPTLARWMDDASVGSVLVEEGLSHTEVDVSDRGVGTSTSLGAVTDYELVGIVTDRDLAVRVVAAGEDPEDLVAADVMTQDPVTVDAGDNIFTVCTKMRQHDVRRIPILDDGRLTGIITMDDILFLLEDEIGNLAEISSDVAAVIESMSPPFPRVQK